MLLTLCDFNWMMYRLQLEKIICQSQVHDDESQHQNQNRIQLFRWIETTKPRQGKHTQSHDMCDDGRTIFNTGVTMG